MTEKNEALRIMAIDCCNHALAALSNVPASRLTAVESQGEANLADRHREVDLIVVGVSKYPVRRVFISQIREIYVGVPMLVLRRLKAQDRDDDVIRGEFILSDQDYRNDLEIVNAIRTVLPLKPCMHTMEEGNYSTVREVMRVISQNYPNADLNLEKLAKALAMSASQLSRILNHEVGVSFRELLRRTRIEEAKRMLALHQYSVKEVAARVGFSDSHYFSRSFKEITGISASDYRSRDAILG